MVHSNMLSVKSIQCEDYVSRIDIVLETTSQTNNNINMNKTYTKEFRNKLCPKSASLPETVICLYTMEQDTKPVYHR